MDLHWDNSSDFPDCGGNSFCQGHPLSCVCGFIKLWGGVKGAESSQHILDYYTYSHVIHGFAFYFLLWLFARRLPVRTRLVLAILFEAAWEIFENSSFIINRYRESTISFDYFGDSVINSLADVASMILGFWLSYRLPIWSVIALLIAMELIIGFLIRDNLTLNIIMLIHPFESIRQWQMGG